MKRKLKSLLQKERWLILSNFFFAMMFLKLVCCRAVRKRLNAFTNTFSKSSGAYLLYAEASKGVCMWEMGLRAFEGLTCFPAQAFLSFPKTYFQTKSSGFCSIFEYWRLLAPSDHPALDLLKIRCSCSKDRVGGEVVEHLHNLCNILRQSK